MSDTRFKPGASGNPRGRPRRKTIRELVGETGLADIVKALVAAAKGGDTLAAKLLIPPMKPELARVEIPELEAAKTLGEKADAIVAAVARGAISPDQAVALSTTLSTAYKAVEIERLAGELLKRIEAIEQGGPRGSV